MSKFLHCTSMNIVVRTLPQVLFATHLYSVWYLVILVMFNSFPVVIWPLSTFSQKTVKGGVPVVTLHSFVTSLPSFTVAFCTCSTAGGTGREKSEGVIGIFLITKATSIASIRIISPTPIMTRRMAIAIYCDGMNPTLTHTKSDILTKKCGSSTQCNGSFPTWGLLLYGPGAQLKFLFILRKKIWYQFSTNFCQALPIF